MTQNCNYCVFFKIAVATSNKYQWALNAYEKWRKWRLTLYNGRGTLKASHQNRFAQPFMDVIDDADKLTVDVSNVIMVVTKENGKDYPPSSLYDLVACLNRYVERECQDFEAKLISSAFAKVKNMLDRVTAECAEQGLGVVKSKDYITEGQEKLLWEKGFLGKSDPNTLHHTFHYLCGSRLGLHGNKEHWALSLS